MLESQSNHLVAVYGSLRQGLGNHAYVRNSEFLGNFRSEEIFTLHSLHGGFPGLKEGGEDSVVFEVYNVDNDTLDRLNRLEGYSPSRPSTFYDRITIKTPYGDAFTYIYVPETDTRLIHGDWTLFRTGVETKLTNNAEQERVCEVVDQTS